MDEGQKGSGGGGLFKGGLSNQSLETVVSNYKKADMTSQPRDEMDYVRVISDVRTRNMAADLEAYVCKARN